MRRVNVFKRVQQKRTQEEIEKFYQTYKYHPRPSYWKNVLDYQANFVEYGLDVEDGEPGIASYTCAIVEKDDGFVEAIPLDLICFIKDNNNA